jgi:phage shock protein PspC (stress-responsive transcriptional regulator)
VEKMSNKVLRRSRDNTMIAGVVGGLANYFGLDVTLFRVIFVLVSVFSAAFPGILVYLILWVLVPKEEVANTTNYSGDNNSR